METVPEVWKSDLEEEKIEKEKELLKKNKIGLDQPPKEARVLSASEILDDIAAKTERELQATLTINEAKELHEILRKKDESQIGKILDLKKEGKIEEIKKLIQSN